MPKKAIVVGASGLIGGHLVDILLKSSEYEQVLVVVRNLLPITNSKIVQEVTDFDRPGQYKDLIHGDVIFCCLGSTRKKTPDLNVYRRIDHDYPVAIARIAFENQVAQYHYVSALGANALSLNFYTKMKGETEDDLKTVGMRTLHIYQPSLLTGQRKEFRLVEKLATGLMAVVNTLLTGSLKKYRSIPAKTVATAMYKLSLINAEGVFTHASDQIKKLA